MIAASTHVQIGLWEIRCRNAEARRTSFETPEIGNQVVTVSVLTAGHWQWSGQIPDLDPATTRG